MISPTAPDRNLDLGLLSSVQAIPSPEEENFWYKQQATARQLREQEDTTPSLSTKLGDKIRSLEADHPIATFLASILPVTGQAVAAADMQAAHSGGSELDQFLATLGMIPGVRPTRKIIAALDDLGEGGIKTLIYELEKAGLVDEDMLKRMFDGDGNLRMFHGTNNSGLDTLTHEGTLANIGSAADTWGGPGTYKASNWDSPLELPRGEDVRILESYIPRDTLDEFMLTNFHSSDLKRMNPGRAKFTVDDQTQKMQDALARMYSDKAPPDDWLDLYDVSQMGTDTPEHFRPRPADEFLDLANRPNPGTEKVKVKDNYRTKFLQEPEQANLRALSQGIKGNFHSDSSGVSAAIFNPEDLIGGNIYDIHMPEMRQALNEAEAATAHFPTQNGWDYAAKSRKFDPDMLMQKAKVEKIREGQYGTPNKVYQVKLEDKANELGSLPPWERETILNEMTFSDDLEAAKMADELLSTPESMFKIKEPYEPMLNDWYKDLNVAETLEEEEQIFFDMIDRGFEKEAASLADHMNLPEQYDYALKAAKNPEIASSMRGVNPAENPTTYAELSEGRKLKMSNNLAYGLKEAEPDAILKEVNRLKDKNPELANGLIARILMDSAQSKKFDANKWEELQALLTKSQ